MLNTLKRHPSEEKLQNDQNRWYSGTDERDQDAEEENGHGVLQPQLSAILNGRWVFACNKFEKTLLPPIAYYTASYKIFNNSKTNT